MKQIIRNDMMKYTAIQLNLSLWINHYKEVIQ